MISANQRSGQGERVKRRIVILAVPRAQELDVIGPASVFSAANQHLGDNHRPYHVELVTAGTPPLIETESGIALVAARGLSSDETTRHAARRGRIGGSWRHLARNRGVAATDGPQGPAVGRRLYRRLCAGGSRPFGWTPRDHTLEVRT